MTKIRLALLLVDAILITGIGLLLCLPLPEIHIPEPEGPVSQASLDAPLPRIIPAPELDHSLFRQSPSETQNREIQETLPAPEIRLVGILVSNEVRIVLIEQQDTPSRRLREGDDIDGWIVTSIESRSMTLTGQGRVAVYPLDPESEAPSSEGEISDNASSQDEILEQPQDPI